MSPVSDDRKPSFLPDSVFRSHSDTSYDSLSSAILDSVKSRRTSAWATGESNDERKMVLKPLQIGGLDQKELSSLLYRRLTKVKSSSKISDHSVSRSYSARSIRKFAETRRRNRGSSIPTEGAGVKVKERTVSNRSLPLPGDEYLRLRNFSVTSKGIVNRGDSFRSKSLLGSSQQQELGNQTPSPLRNGEETTTSNPRRFAILLIGGPGVGKTSMRKQFMTSEYICANDSLTDVDPEKAICVVLNSEESQLEFDEETWHENKAYHTNCPLSDAFVIVYSVTDRRSFGLAKGLLSQVERFADSKAVILAANKTDLARTRTVTTEEGRSLAKDRGCKFIETSVAINHHVDELLVGALAQIRMKLRRKSQGTYGGSKASGVLKKIWRKACLRSKSCDNLHVL